MRLPDNLPHLRLLTMDSLWGSIKVGIRFRHPWTLPQLYYVSEPPPPPPPPPPPSPEELDIMRHREITSKAVSAILMLTLQWFKVSRAFLLRRNYRELLTLLSFTDVMKFHHFGQLLLDSNCLLLILKMFGLQEVATTVVAKNESPDHKYVVT